MSVHVRSWTSKSTVPYTEQQTANCSDDRCVAPMVPMPISERKADCSIGKRNTTGRDQGPGKGLLGTEERCGVDSNAHEDVPDTIWNTR